MHCHACPRQGVLRAGTGRFQAGQYFRHVLRQGQGRGPRLMAALAGGIRAGQDGGGGGFGGMRGMADGATRPALGIKRPAMLRTNERFGRGGVALGAGLGDPPRAGGGKRVADRAGGVDAMAIHTLGHPLAAGGQQLAVDTGLVFGQLVHAWLRLVFAHEIGVAVAFSAELGNALARDPDLETAAGVHRDVLVGFRGIAAVTIGATYCLGKMDVIGEPQTHPFHYAMTIKAGILADTSATAQQGNQRHQLNWKLHETRFGPRLLLDKPRATKRSQVFFKK